MRLLTLWLLLVSFSLRAAERPFFTSEPIFPAENWHNHGSCIVEASNGDLIVCWYHGSGERKADDCRIEGARWKRGAKGWGKRFVMADTPDYPDTNCSMFIDARGRLWLVWPTILDNHWESALLKYRLSTDYLRDKPPRWDWQEVLHVTPGEAFSTALSNEVKRLQARPFSKEIQETIDYAAASTNDKLKTRLGWMTRAHPVTLRSGRIVVPLYSDGFNFSLMAWSDDYGAHWKASQPLIGEGNVQPSVVQRKDGSLVAFMRDNGPPPMRVMQASSQDGGETWSAVTDTELLDPGAGLEAIVLKNGNWILVNNDTEKGRQSLCVSLSDDEGKTWKWRRHLERDPVGPTSGGYSYPSVMQARNGSIHVTYSHRGPILQGVYPGEFIKHTHFNEAWISEGDPAAVR